MGAPSIVYSFKVVSGITECVDSCVGTVKKDDGMLLFFYSFVLVAKTKKEETRN
jgi:hypothetical protein